MPASLAAPYSLAENIALHCQAASAAAVRQYAEKRSALRAGGATIRAMFGLGFFELIILGFAVACPWLE